MQRRLSRTGATHAKKFEGRAVFICGFVDQRWHNSSLLAIAAELLSQCYVSCNEGQGTEKGALDAIHMIEKAEAMLFYANEFTLKDAQCLLVLQHAFYKGIPVIMLRPPRTKLIVGDTFNDHRTQRPSNSLQNPYKTDKPLVLDGHLLQRILHKEFKKSIVYDRLEHKKSMNRITKKIEKCTEAKKEKSDGTTSDDETPDEDPSLKDKKKLLYKKHSQARSVIRGLERSTVSWKKNNQNESRKCHSLCNLPTLTATSEGKFSTTGTNSLRPQKILASATLPINKSTIKKTSERVTSKPSSRSSVSTIDDTQNYHATQYLVFPVKDKTLMPQLIQFPSDVLNNEELQPKDHWGSDSSLEETVEIAQTIQGDIHIGDYGTNHHVNDFELEDAPYIDPL